MSLDAPEIRIVDAWRVACDGGEGALGHPRAVSYTHLTLPTNSGV